MLNNQEDWIHHQNWEDKEILMNIEIVQASRSKHELHVEHEQKLTLLSLQSRSDNTLTLTSCYDLIMWHARQWRRGQAMGCRMIVAWPS